jgi:DNA end-binding protein Ku
MRSMWKGAVSFGLVMIPVKLYAATETKDIAFRQVHREDGGRIRFRRFCSIDEQEVAYEDVAKGYELADGEMIVLSEDDMADLPLPSTRSIEVVQFTPADQVDPILFNRSYYIEPEGPGARAYCLLRDALEESGKVAIAQVALRQREALAILRSREGVLVLETLLWPDEIRVAAFPFLDDNIEVRPQELRMASSLIESMTVDFDPADYHDNYREALQQLIEAKVEGREVIEPQEPAAAAEAPSSLADALRASLEAAKAGSAKAGSAKAAPTKASTAKASTAKSSPAEDGAAEAGTAKADTAAKTGTAKQATAKSGTKTAKKAPQDGADEGKTATQRRARKAS